MHGDDREEFSHAVELVGKLIYLLHWVDYSNMLHCHCQVFEGTLKLETSLALGFLSLLIILLLKLVHGHIHCPLVGLFVLHTHLIVLNFINERLYGVLSDLLKVQQYRSVESVQTVSVVRRFYSRCEVYLCSHDLT